eukprot:SAG22_NODE_1356_length_4631_cov_2.105693_7_plen_346_part_00
MARGRPPAHAHTKFKFLKIILKVNMAPPCSLRWHGPASGAATPITMDLRALLSVACLGGVALPTVPHGAATTAIARCPPAAADCTAQLQAALSQPGAATVVIPAAPAGRDVWPSRPLSLYNTSSNRRIVLEAGVVIEAVKGQFQNGADSLLSCLGLENVSFVGGAGSGLRMHKADYADPHKYNHSESRMGLQLLGCKNVSVDGWNISSTGGDGICEWASALTGSAFAHACACAVALTDSLALPPSDVAGWGRHDPALPNGTRPFVVYREHSANISVANVHCHDNCTSVVGHSPPPSCLMAPSPRLTACLPRADRQGMSIISVVGMQVHFSSFTGTNGTAPQFGIE